MRECIYRSAFSGPQRYEWLKVSVQLHTLAALPPGERVPGNHWI
jgi:hypothetical protein